MGQEIAPISPYANPWVVTDPNDCWFYHSMDIPGHGEVVGQWDLRGNVDAYLGGVDLRGKQVLEVGTANGYLCLHMEKQGADVVACDLSPEHSWDIVPFARHEVPQNHSLSRNLIRRLNNAFWLAHRAYRSRARVVYTPAYAIPSSIEPVDVATYCSVLLHLRDPFQALASGLRLTRETVIVTDVAERPGETKALAGFVEEPIEVSDLKRSLFVRMLRRLQRMLVFPLGVNAGTFGFEPEQIERLTECVRQHERRARLSEGSMAFLPDHRTGDPTDTWWSLSPEVVCRFLGVLGFEATSVTYHQQFYVPERRMVPMFTVVGRRTVGHTLSMAA